MKIERLIEYLENFMDNGITDIPSISYSDETGLIDLIYIENNNEYGIAKLTEKDITCTSKYDEEIWICNKCIYKDECILENLE